MRKLISLQAILALMFAILSSSASAWSLREGAGHLVGEEGYVCGFPLVMMDVTRQVVTAAAKTGEYAAPINQFGRIRTYVNPDFRNVVLTARIYQPTKEMLDGGYRLPPVTRVP